MSSNFVGIASSLEFCMKRINVLIVSPIPTYFRKKLCKVYKVLLIECVVSRLIWSSFSLGDASKALLQAQLRKPSFVEPNLATS